MFKVTLLTAKQELYVGLALKAVLPAREGQVTILDFHQPILTRLAKGVIAIDDRWFFKVKDGVIKMTGFELLGIVDT